MKVILSQLFITGWSYNSADLPVTMTYPNPGSEVVTSTYLPQMALDTLTGNDDYITDSQYDSASRLRNQAFGNGITQTHTYNDWDTQGGRLQNMTAGTLQNLNYSYDAVGNILSILDSNAGPQTQTFTYDTLDRLTSAAAAGGQNGLYAETYRYNSSTGNLSLKSGLNYSYLDSAHAHAVTGLSNGNAYTYDANGNQTSRIIGVDTYSLTYDAENQLTTVTKNGQPLASFVYDGDGVQVAATVNGITTKYVGGIYEVEGTNVTKYYGGRAAMRSNGVLSYTLQDHLGSTALVTDSLGNLVSEQRYKAWGETRYSSSAATTDYLYTGQRDVKDIGLYFYKARWYDPSLGRFNQADSIVPGAGDPRAWDKYSYVKNNPVMYNDPSGHWGFEFNGSNIINNLINMIGNGVTGSQVTSTLDTYSTVLDTIALAIDTTIAIGDITSAGIGAFCGAAIAAPEGEAPVVLTGPAGALLGAGYFELNPYVRAGLTAGNALATVSTIFTGLADLISGDNNLQFGIEITSSGIEYEQELTISKGTLTSGVLTGLGMVSPIGLTSFTLQGAAVLNDHDKLYPQGLKAIPERFNFKNNLRITR